jgi:hypothetical protein
LRGIVRILSVKHLKEGFPVIYGKQLVEKVEVFFTAWLTSCTDIRKWSLALN